MIASFRLSDRRAVAAAVLALCASANAAVVNVTVTVQNLAPTNSISFAPLHVGFNNGSFDAFNLGGVATAPIISVAEGGAGGAWQAAFAAADPGATRGTIGGLLLPGATSSLTFQVDTALNPFFTFGAMAVPSNDFFIGNDSPANTGCSTQAAISASPRSALRPTRSGTPARKCSTRQPRPLSATTACAVTRTRWWPSTLPSSPPSTG